MLGNTCIGLALESQMWHELLSLAVLTAMGMAGMSIP